MNKTKSEKWYDSMRNKRGKTARNQYTKAAELGLPIPKMKEETRKKLSDAGKSRGPLSEETKKKISESRIKYLRENPHMVPYKLNHYSKGRSYPEEYWKAILDTHGISYVEQYQIGPYQLDFAIGNVDLEIDGDQHYLDERVVASDKRRNEYLKNLGWKIIRIKWSDYQKITDKKTYIEHIIKQIVDMADDTL
jgi:very-short-patch-repair endonuclease